MQKVENWKVLDSRYVIREPFFVLRRDRVEMPHGAVLPSYYVMEFPAWICVIAVTKEGQFVIERQYRHGIGRVIYELCAGIVDPTDATFLEAAQRELLEETGYGKGVWQEYMQVTANAGNHNNISYCFLATGVKKVGERHLEATEDIAVDLMSPAEVWQLLMENQIPQAIHAAALWKYFAETEKSFE